MVSSIKTEDILSVGAGSLLNINWELVSHCQFNCTYCYYRPFKSQTDYRNLSQLILKKLDSLATPAKITLLGGEPSLHPRFFEIVERLSNNPMVREIAIVTNFKKKLDFWTKLLPYKQKLKLVISYHAEYEIDDFLEKLDHLRDKLMLDFVFVVHPKEKYLDRMKKMAREVQQEKYSKMSLNFVPVHYDNDGSEKDYAAYPTATLSFMREQQEATRKRENLETLLVRSDASSEHVPKFEILNRQLNQFKGWDCHLGAYIIHEDGMVTKACTREKKHALVTKFEHFKLTCPFRICECDDYWAFEKFKKPTT